MKNLKSFNSFKINESKLQDDYRSFFSHLLELYGIKSPLQFKNKEEESKKFYADVSKGWSKGVGLTEYGKKLMGIESFDDLDGKVDESLIVDSAKTDNDIILKKKLAKKWLKASESGNTELANKLAKSLVKDGILVVDADRYDNTDAVVDTKHPTTKELKKSNPEFYKIAAELEKEAS
jgi:hypothetical protein